MSGSARLEEEHVHRVYDSIAAHFSDTRHKPWPRVQRFLDSLPQNSFVVDIGCGNGKYLSPIGGHSRHVTIGCDRSAALLAICGERGFETVSADILQTCHVFRAQLFDAALCVAVLHHLSSRERRLRALQAIVDCVRVGGKIYVWALEQSRDGQNAKYLKKERPEEEETKKEKRSVCVDGRVLGIHAQRTAFASQEVLVPFGSEEQLRYYHVFAEHELEELAREVRNARVLDNYYENGNWVLMLERTINHATV
ncbi:unnamed protein product [Medioppia subpectinata]|uniref:Methyltransferase type 11 domain-containing protein n=1 Tax=Medioppia subpectinata TaxID=1979941 RepID=A0A7R9PVU5_9ACAR|nr:unnamed protein product [Medioppia subpectinata]CAG2102174.1 unnamed protein product [Medioppia subpectinata]